MSAPTYNLSKFVVVVIHQGREISFECDAANATDAKRQALQFFGECRIVKAARA